MRYLFVILPLLSLSAFAASMGFISFRDSDGLVVWVGSTLDQARADLGVEWRSQNQYSSSVLHKPLFRYDLYLDIGDRSPDDAGALLRSWFDPSDPFSYAPIDWQGDFTQPLTPLLPSGYILYHDSLPFGIVGSDGNKVKMFPLSSDGSGGYVTTSPVVVDGSSGSYSVSYSPDTGWRIGFTPSWSGGVSESGSSSSLSGGSSYSSVVPYGGSGSSASTVFNNPSSSAVTTQSGDTYNVISVPSQTVTLDNGSSITLYDYSSLLNAIGANVSSGFNKLHDDLDTINENQRKQLETDDPVSVAENTDPSVDTSSVESEAQEQLDIINRDGSGWRFDFGMGSNPIGELITSFFGDPPTDFGQQDDVCHVTFELPLVGDLEYYFKLSDWFPSAFRSCILMILTFFFAIASAKAISGAFQ